MSKHNPILLESYLRALRLPAFLKEYAKAAREFAQNDRGSEAFLEHLAELEVNHREARATARRLKEARFPSEKNLSDFDFTAVPGLSKKRMLELFTCRFIQEKACVVMLGCPGCGQVALGDRTGPRGVPAWSPRREVLHGIGTGQHLHRRRVNNGRSCGWSRISVPGA